VRQDTDTAGEDEQPAGQLGGKPEFGVHRGSGTVDVHGNGALPTLIEISLKSTHDPHELTADVTALGGVIEQPKQRVPTWVDRMEAVTETRKVWTSATLRNGTAILGRWYFLSQ
jgi:hypothetical protein